MWSNILYPLTPLLQCCYRQYHVHGSTSWFFFFTNILINLQMKSLNALFLQSVSTFLQFGGSFWLWYIMNWSTSLSRVTRHIRKHTVPNKTNNRKKKTKIITTTTTTKNSCPSISTLEVSCVFLGDALRSYRSAISLYLLRWEVIGLNRCN